jgi:transposase
VDAQKRIAELEAELAARDARIAAQDVRIAEQDARIEALTKQVSELLEKLNQNSKNSHLPPSSDGPGARPSGPGKKKSVNKRGGQRGHRGNHRQLVAPEQVDKFVELFPAECSSCWKPLAPVADAFARRYQVTEVPPIVPHTTEYRRHAVTCGCGHKTRAAYDRLQIPDVPFGPRLMAMIALLTGVYHVSRRQAAALLSDFVGVRISLGAISSVEQRVGEAVQPAVNEAWQSVGRATVKHTDGTSWLMAGVTLSLWTLATATATVFKVVSDSSKKTLQPLYGALRGILVSDRAKALNFWAMERRQVCWAHLLRKFVSFSERDGPAGAFGKELLEYTGLMFLYWHDYKANRLDREKMRAWMAPVQVQLEAVLERAVAADVERLSGSCADILDHKKALWTFIERDDVEPTNNHAERELRAFVLWRRRSFGTQSERGNRFAERVMTVAHTARRQQKNVLAFLTACCRAQREQTTAPSLFVVDVASSL